MKILITGAAGFIGSHLAEALALYGHDVIGVDCFTPYYDRHLKELNIRGFSGKGIVFKKVDIVTADITKLVSDVDVVYHLSAQPGISSSVHFDDYINNNIKATHRLLESALKSKRLKQFVFVSTSSVYGKFAKGDETTAPAPSSYYGVTKLAAEQLSLAYHRDKKLPVTVVRPFSVYGERERPEKLYPRLIHSILNDEEFPMYEGSLEHMRSYTHVSDVVLGLVMVMEQMDRAIGEIFNIGNDQAVTTRDGIRLIEKYLGKKAKFKYMPKRHGDQIETSANIKKAKKILGYSPKISLKDGLKREVEWYKNFVHGKL